MPGVHWSRRAKAKLEAIDDDAVRDQLTINADEVLHHMPPVSFPQDEGFEGEVMWHRGIPCGTPHHELLAQEDDDGPWNYFLFYTRWRPHPEDPGPDKDFEILYICDIGEVAAQWEGMRAKLPDASGATTAITDGAAEKPSPHQR
jgi:hypothetical protein